MDKKDYFSGHSKLYADFRPLYPPALYAFIFQHLEGTSCAWDCATGNGQVARHLANHFDTVYATDISRQQIDHAFAAKNIRYQVSAAEETTFSENQFDLITVAQAMHWIHADAFYQEVNRTLKRRGLIALWGYSLASIESAIDEILIAFYKDTTGPYWDPARKLVDDHYRSIPFPFEQITCPEFNIRVTWTPAQFAGYVTSWSAIQKYMQLHGINPVEDLMHRLKKYWKADEARTVTFPLFMKLGRVDR